MAFDLKKLLVSLAVAVVVFCLLFFVVKALVSVVVLDVVLSLADGAAVYLFVAWWEIKKLYDEAKAALGK
jgi:5-bromo-4-chloroindolyl phosphate hydrolysis protein